jgi:hypothetical protein
MPRRRFKITLITGIVISLISLGWIAWEIWFGLTQAR